MRERILVIILVAVVSYAGVSVTAYRFRHTGMSETEIFLHIPDALMWR